jgi:hypothetical protein
VHERFALARFPVLQARVEKVFIYAFGRARDPYCSKRQIRYDLLIRASESSAYELRGSRDD